MARRKQQPRTTADGRMNEAAAAQFIGVSASCMSAWRRCGKGPVYVALGRIWYCEDDLEEWIRAHRTNPVDAAEAKSRRVISTKQHNAHQSEPDSSSSRVAMLAAARAG